MRVTIFHISAFKMLFCGSPKPYSMSLQQNDEYVIRRWARFKNNVFYFKELAIK